ncbi:NADP-binding protein [Gigaspora margarita]|uniref:NADP-binding protein n=1 Tax=Gigaspora margarita TaxID=4874 RepID=A0A8H3XCS3_GIGMA|nr:NADP-binding protein [Gigaspora margarita]
MESSNESYDLSNKVIIITGSTGGIGRSFIRIISSYNPKRLVLPIRDRVKGEQLLEYIRNSQDGKVECIELWDIDLADLHSVKRFADKFVKEVGELHYLWNHAGVFNFSKNITKDNFEEQFQVNHLSHFLLTTLLIPTMKRSATPESPCKINFTGSDTMKIANIDLDNLNGEKSSGFVKLHANSKLENVVYSNELNRRLKSSNVISLACHPGLVNTNMGNVLPFLEPLKHLFMSTFGLPPDTGAKYILYPVLKASIEDGGKYYDQYKLVNLTGQATDENFAKKFWDKCEEVLRNFDAGLLE